MTLRLRALVVSANSEQREAVLTSLQTWYPSGLQEHEAESVPRALQVIKARRPNLILCELDGLKQPLLLKQLCGRPGCATIGFYRDTPGTRTEAEFILEAMRLGFDDVVKHPFELAAIDPVLARVLDRDQQELRRQGGRVYSVLSSKGGGGATTVAVNLAVAHAEAGESVCLFDASRQLGSARYYLGLEPGRDVTDAVAQGGALTVDSLQRLVARHEPTGVALLDAPRDMSGALDGEGVAHVVGVLREAFDVVICDIEPGIIDGYKVGLFDVSDRLCLVFESIVPSIRAATTLLRELAGLRYPAEKLVPTLNRYSDFAGNVTSQTVADTMGATIAAVLPYERELLVAANQGVPFLLHRPGRPFSEAVRQLALALVPGPGSEELFVLRPAAAERPGGGLLQRLGALLGGSS